MILAAATLTPRHVTDLAQGATLAHRYCLLEQVAGRYVMTGMRDGIRQTHSLSVADTPLDRLAAHWAGFTREA